MKIYSLVTETIKAVYPKYYPQEVVDFFCQHHKKENILKDIENGSVGVLVDNGQLVGTGSYNENHITRVFVAPKFQRQGYGSFIMQTLEFEISRNYDTVYLDASLPASHMYEKREYEVQKHEKLNVENGAVLVYEVMQKRLNTTSTTISYNGRKFMPKINSENGEVDNNTIFNYQQSGNILWADYSGGEIIKGYIVGNVAENGELDFYYQHINQNNEVRIGKCHSIPKILDNGKIELNEKWQWLNGDKSSGTSILNEM